MVDENSPAAAMAGMGAPAPQLSNAFANAAVLALDAYQDMSVAARSVGWQPLDAATLGLAPSGRSGADLYTFRDGVYVAADADNSAVAHVHTGVLDGQPALAIAFRGTDEAGDIADHKTFATHYAHFAPLIDAVESYLAGPGSGIERVLVTGHSLGSAMVATAMIEEGWANDPGYLGVAFAAHGTDAPVAATATAPIANLVNVSHTQDPLLLSSDPRGLPADALAAPLDALAQAVNEVGYEEKARVGTDLWIDTGNAAASLEPSRLSAVGDPIDAEHRMPALLADVTVLAGQGQLDPATLLSAAGPRFFYVASEDSDNIAQDRTFASDALNQRFFPAQDFDQRIFALAGDDRIAGGGGDDFIDGGTGADLALFSADRADYAIATVDGVVTVTPLAPAAADDGVDRLVNVEYLGFADGVVAADGGNGTIPQSILDAAALEPIGLIAGLDLAANTIDDLLS